MQVSWAVLHSGTSSCYVPRIKMARRCRKCQKLRHELSPFNQPITTCSKAKVAALQQPTWFLLGCRLAMNSAQSAWTRYRSHRLRWLWKAMRPTAFRKSFSAAARRWTSHTMLQRRVSGTSSQVALPMSELVESLNAGVVANLVC